MLKRRAKVLSVPRLERERITALALAFHDAAQRPFCAVCHEPRTEALDPHHLIQAHTLREEFKRKVGPLRMAAIQYDVRNVVGICRRCHDGHHGPSLRSPLTSAHLPESAWEFAREMDALALELDPRGGTARFTVRLEQYPESVRSPEDIKFLKDNWNNPRLTEQLRGEDAA